MGLALLTVTLAWGCSPVSMATSAFSEISGADGDLHAVQAIASGALSGFNSIEFSPAFTTVGSTLAPPGLLREYDSSIVRLKSKTLVLPGGAPTLNVSTEFLYFHKKGLTSGGVCLCRVKGHADGKLLFDSIVYTESKSFTQGGETALGEATARAVIEYIKPHTKVGT